MNEPVKVTPQQAIDLLDRATQPAVISTLKRVDLLNIQVALETLAKFVQETEKPKKLTPP